MTTPNVPRVKPRARDYDPNRDYGSGSRIIHPPSEYEAPLIRKNGKASRPGREEEWDADEPILPDPTVQVPQNTRERMFLELKEDVYERAMSGDTASAKLWLEMYREEAPDQTFNVKVDIVPYEVADKSLSRIIQNTDPVIVDEMLGALLARCVRDHAPLDIQDAVRTAARKFAQWASYRYAPQDE